jgi:hypothetical protein
MTEGWTQLAAFLPVNGLLAPPPGRQAFAIQLGPMLFATGNFDPNTEGSVVPAPAGSIFFRSDLDLGGGSEFLGPTVYAKAPDGFWYPQ